MKIKEFVMKKKHGEQITVSELKEVYFASLEEDFNVQLEKLRKQGELWFPKKNIIERIG